MAGSALRWWAAGVVLAVAVIVGSMCWEVVSLRLLHSPEDVTSHRFFATHHALNHTFQLSNGESVRMPYQVYDGRQLLLVARTRLDVARSFLAELELHPWQIDQHHALALTGIIDYIDCVAGPYGEWFLSFFATRSAEDGSRWFGLRLPLAFMLHGSGRVAQTMARALGLPEVYVVVYRMVVDSERSLYAGRDIWGYPKDLAVIETNDAKVSRALVRARVEIDSQAVVSLEHKSRSPYGDWLALPLELDGITVTPARFKHTFGHTSARMFQYVGLWNSDAGDRLRVWDSTPLGRDIAALEVDPMLWLNVPYFWAAFHMPFWTKAPSSKA